MSITRALAIGMLLLGGCRAGAERAGAEEGWWKGQTHLHSGNSGDSRTQPEEVARWYEAHGFDFAVFTDHNFVTKLAPAGKMLLIPGAELTQNLATCDPAPEDRRGCLLHVNALFATRPGRVALPEMTGRKRLEVYLASVEAARGLSAIAQINHPNFAGAADARLVAELGRRGLALMEIANQGHDSTNERAGARPSTEEMWDAVLTEGVDVWGVASDDAHHYADAEAVKARGEEPYVGDRGWIMVHAKRSVEGIREAIVKGDFYASTGVVLKRVETTKEALEIEAVGGAEEIRFIGAGGKELARVKGGKGRFVLEGARGGYVRAVVRDSKGRKAWTQPVRVK